MLGIVSLVMFDDVLGVGLTADRQTILLQAFSSFKECNNCD